MPTLKLTSNHSGSQINRQPLSDTSIEAAIYVSLSNDTEGCREDKIHFCGIRVNVPVVRLTTGTLA